MYPAQIFWKKWLQENQEIFMINQSPINPKWCARPKWHWVLCGGVEPQHGVDIHFIFLHECTHLVVETAGDIKLIYGHLVKTQSTHINTLRTSSHRIFPAIGQYNQADSSDSIGYIRPAFTTWHQHKTSWPYVHLVSLPMDCPVMPLIARGYIGHIGLSSESQDSGWWLLMGPTGLHHSNHSISSSTFWCCWCLWWWWQMCWWTCRIRTVYWWWWRWTGHWSHRQGIHLIGLPLIGQLCFQDGHSVLQNQKSSVTPWYQHRTGHFHEVACQDWPIWLSNQSPLHAAAGFLTTFVMRVNIMSFTVISVIICYLPHILSFLIITVGWGMFRMFRYVRCVMVVGLYADSSDSIQLDLQFPCGLSLKFCFMIFHDSWFVTQGMMLQTWFQAECHIASSGATTHSDHLDH